MTIADVEVRELANHVLDRTKEDLATLDIPVERLPDGVTARVVSRRQSFFDDEPERPVYTLCFVAIAEQKSAIDELATRLRLR